MKFAKRILVAVLAVALLTSVFALSSVAEKDREYDYRLSSIEEAEQILEYYALEEYLADNYEDGTYNQGLIKETKSGGKSPEYKVEADPLNPDNKVLMATLPRSRVALGYERRAAAGEILTDKLIVSARVYFDSTASKGLNLTLTAGLQSEKDPASRYFDIVTLDMKTGALSYSGWNESTQIMVEGANTYEGWAASTGKWYDLLITFNAEADYYNLKVMDVPTDGSEAAVLADIGNVAITGATGMAGFTFSVKHTANNAAKFAFDNVEIYEGTTTRSPSYRPENTKIHVEDLVAFYAEEDTDAATKLRIANTLYELYATYGVDVSYDNTVSALVAMYETLAAKFVDRAADIDATLNYVGRVEWIEKIEEYEDKLPANEDLAVTPGMTPELIDSVVAARLALANEYAEVEEVKTHSENFIDFMTNVYDPTNKDYVQMQVWIAELSDLYTEDNVDFYGFDIEKYPYQTRFYSKLDTSYEGVEEHIEAYEDLLQKFYEMTVIIESFIVHVDSLELSPSFGARYIAYVQANAEYNNGVLHPALDNNSHTELKARIEYYLKVEPGIIQKKAECEEFITIVKEASIASYYTVFVEKLDLAIAAYDLIALDYENIADYVEVYNFLKLRRSEIEFAATEYINAVNAIEYAGDDFYAKKEAVLYATELKAAGDVLGFPGVKEANMVLSAADADVKFREFSSTTLISLVEQIAATDSIEERRALLRLANDAKDSAEADYEGVEEAKATFEAELERFTADVKAANAAIASACDAAAAIVSAVNGVSIFNK